jgi:hypothetical protein
MNEYQGVVPGTLADIASLMTNLPGLRRGITDVIYPVAPALPATVNHVIPSEWWERTLGIDFTLNCGSTVGNRSIAIQYSDANGIILGYVPVIANVAANSVTQIIGMLSRQGPLSPSQSLQAYGTATSPAASTAIAVISNVGAGFYQAEWMIELNGTPSATDIDNFELLEVGGGLVAHGLNLGAIGQWPQQPVVINQSTSGVVQVKSIAAGTTGAIYSAGLWLQPLAFPYPIVQLPDFVMKSGWYIQLVISNAQAGDTITNWTHLVERYPGKWARGQNFDVQIDRLEYILGR